MLIYLRPYLYILDYYCWDEPINNTLKENMDRIASFCANNDAVMIRGLPNSHFSSEVLSWQGLNGIDPAELLPAIMITTKHPSYFIENDNSSCPPEITDSMVFIKLRDVCKDASELVTLLEGLFSDIKSEQRIKDFAISKQLHKSHKGALVDPLVLQPNIGGLGVNLNTD